MNVRAAIRLLLAGALGLSTALLLACGSANTAGLIPATNAGPLKSDFDAVASAVTNHDCRGASSALHQVGSELRRLPRTLDAHLHQRLVQGYVNLLKVTPQQCQQTTSTATTPPTTTTPTDTTPTQTTTPPTTPTQTTPTQTTPTPVPTTPTPTTSTPPPGNGGGAPAPDGGGAKKKGDGNGAGNGGGAGAPGQ